RHTCLISYALAALYYCLHACDWSLGGRCPNRHHLSTWAGQGRLNGIVCVGCCLMWLRTSLYLIWRV
uniref:Uncharacterized protein n=1 Tax=Ciona intestinalis TaxID=7719 RepID=H2XWF7_CIOIN